MSNNLKGTGTFYMIHGIFIYFILLFFYESLATQYEGYLAHSGIRLH